MDAKIIEIFSSLQGEGLWVGKEQVFVRFHGCSLKCKYCDTPLTHQHIKESRIEYPPFSKKFEKHSLLFNPSQLDQTLSRFSSKSLALTGGEPLEQGGFINEWLSSTKENYEVLLETSGIEVNALKVLIDKIDMVSLDIKLPSSSGERSYWNEHYSFIKIALEKKAYAKVVFDENISENELSDLSRLIKEFPHLIVFLQMVSPIQKRDLKRCLSIFQNLSQKHPNQIRFLPQVHKFLSVL